MAVLHHDAQQEKKRQEEIEEEEQEEEERREEAEARLPENVAWDVVSRIDDMRAYLEVGWDDVAHRLKDSRDYDSLRHMYDSLNRAISDVIATLEPVLDTTTLELNPWAKVDAHKNEEHDHVREFMQASGWPEHLAAIADEHGTLLYGHRMVWIAKELGIEPVIKTVRFESDEDRINFVRLANMDFEPFTASEILRVYMYLDWRGNGLWRTRGAPSRQHPDSRVIHPKPLRPLERLVLRVLAVPGLQRMPRQRERNRAEPHR